VSPTIIERAQHPVSRRDIDPNVLKVLYRLIGAGHIAYLVGGGVRDLMMGRRPKDFDVATSAHPHQVRELFRNSRLIGRRFRLVHVFFGPQNIEVATFRRRSEEIPESDDPLIRHDNTFGTPEEDAFRRDFTANALFYDPGTFQVIDYADGVTDLQAGLIRTIGDPELRMREDPVRMIRAVRFAIKLGFEIESDTRTAMERHRSDLIKASVPRLVEETFRTVALAGADQALVLLERFGILELLLPFIAEHLSVSRLARQRTLQNLAVMGRALQEGQELSRPFILGCLFADYHLSQPQTPASENRFALVDALRARGFSKADTEHMRLLLEALTHITIRSRTLRRLAQRPYFEQARQLYELVAPSVGQDSTTLNAHLAAPAHPPARLGTGRRRRRRRGGRRRGRGEGHLAAVSEPTLNGDMSNAPHSSDLTTEAFPASEIDHSGGTDRDR
jgi:poly(A) polymerase